MRPLSTVWQQQAPLKKPSSYPELKHTSIISADKGSHTTQSTPLCLQDSNFHKPAVNITKRRISHNHIPLRNNIITEIFRKTTNNKIDLAKIRGFKSTKTPGARNCPYKYLQSNITAPGATELLHTWSARIPCRPNLRSRWFFKTRPVNQLRWHALILSKSNSNQDNCPFASKKLCADGHQSLLETNIKRFDARQRQEKGLKFKVFDVQIPGQAGYDT